MKIATLLLLTASAAWAQQHPYAEIFPSDYTPSSCASKEPCLRFSEVSMPAAAHAFLLRTMDIAFDEKYSDELTYTAQRYCAKRATCNASPGRMFWFCNDVFAQELRASCDPRFDPVADKENNTQCHTWMDTFSAAVDQRGSGDWAEAQKCAAAAAPSPETARHMDWWSVPAEIAADYTGKVTIYVLDRETHVPVQADIRFEDQILYATDPPSGRPTSYYPFQWPRKLLRIARPDGYSDLVPSKMTISAPGYKTITTVTPAEIRKIITTVHTGKGSMTITAVDSRSGQPVEGQVYLGGQTIGFTNQPIAITLKTKHPDVWVRSPFDAFSDVVIIPAAR